MPEKPDPEWSSSGWKFATGSVRMPCELVRPLPPMESLSVTDPAPPLTMEPASPSLRWLFLGRREPVREESRSPLESLCEMEVSCEVVEAS